ncbi:MAG: hypothetical protein ACREK6_09185 [Candidatus Rokuibacteriota bacterium]
MASVLSALALLGPVVVGAQPSAPSEGAPPSLGDWGFKGALLGKSFAHFAETPNDDRNFRNEGILQIGWERRLASWADARIVGEGRIDDYQYADDVYFYVPEDNEHRSYLALKEAVLGFQKHPVKLTLGKQFFAWGTADGYNPTDNLNPYDYLDPIDREKLAVYSVAAQFTAGPTSLTLVLVPLFTPSRVPLATTRWVPPLPEDIAALTESRDLPPNTAGNMQYGARLRGTVAGWDLSVSYFEGFEPTPVIKQTTAVVAPGVKTPTFTPVFTRLRVAGFDFSTTFGKLEVHGEAAAKFVVRDGRDDRLQWIAGVNYTWDELGLRWLDRIHLIAEYAREEVFASDSGSEVLDLDDRFALPNNAFRDAAIGRLLFHFDDATELEIGGTVNFEGSVNHYLKAALTHKATDALHVTVGVDLFNGPRDTFWGRWRDNDRLYMFLKYLF